MRFKQRKGDLSSKNAEWRIRDNQIKQIKYMISTFNM